MKRSAQIWGLLTVAVLLSVFVGGAHASFVAATLSPCTNPTGCVGGHSVSSGGLFNYILFECVATTTSGTVQTVTWGGLGQTGSPGLAKGILTTDIFTITGSTCAGLVNVTPTLIAQSASIDMNTLPIAPGISGNPAGLVPYTFIFTRGPAIASGTFLLIGLQQNSTDNGAGGATMETQQNGNTDAAQNYGTCTTGVGDCSDLFTCNAVDNCMSYTLNEFNPETPTNPSPSPYGANPLSYPCCNPVTAQALSGASLRAPDVDSLPLIWLFILLLIVTLGSYVVVRSRQKRPPARQYELGI